VEVVTLPIPCLRCGKQLDKSDDGTGYVVCACGAHYDDDVLAQYAKPGYYREWLSAFGCTCGRVDRYSDESTVLLTRHYCKRGGVGMLPNNN